MKRITTLLLVLGIFAVAQAVADAQLTEEMKRDGWVSIFNGTTLEGWKVNEPGGSGNFKVENGAIVGTGGKNHLYYMGEQYQNFELKIDVKTSNKCNSGVYVKAQWQDASWPTTGFELQVNCSHGDPVKTGSLYNIIKIYKAPHNDDEWFTYHLTCNKDTLDVRVNGETLYTYVDPGGARGSQSDRITERNKRISQRGHIALQQHDPGGSPQFKNIFIKKLPD